MENDDLAEIEKHLKSGSEQLIFNNNPIGTTLLDFWRWTVSDIVSNATRGIFAEFIIANAMKIDIKQVRDEWSAFDLITPEGIKLEIKSAAYMQSWKQKEKSVISFSIKSSLRWDPTTGTYDSNKKRQADVYVFCLLKPEVKAGLDPLNINQWGFYIIPAKIIDSDKKENKSISLSSIQKIANEIKYDEIRETILSLEY